MVVVPHGARVWLAFAGAVAAAIFPGGAALPYASVVSDYYDVFLTFALKPDLPPETMTEIRWHLALGQHPPASFAAFRDDGWFLEKPFPFFNGTVASHAFEGVDVTALVWHEGRWLVTVRSCVHEDEINYAGQLIEWMAAQSSGSGWIGYLRHSQATAPDLIFWHDGELDFRKPAPQLR
jgi:hypothetical protein